MQTSLGVAVASCALLLAGCSGGPLATSVKTSPVQGAAIQGIVHGGQAVISGASIYLFAANNTGYGDASISLLNSSVLGQTPAGGKDANNNYYVTTASDGSFAITGDYTCPSTTSQIYLYATGGNPGSSGTNSAIGLLAALGTCPANGTLSSSLFIVINEVSTIAMSYSVAGYTTDPLHVSAPNTTLAQTGIANAFATVTNLETLGSGLALATTPTANGGSGTVPQTEINTLSNILASCVNSNGPAFTPCATLFANSMNGSTAPTDTATAAINIAHNPTANIAALYGLQTGITAFQPMLSAQPSDFTLAVNYTGGGLNAPAIAAIDASGNLWVANNGADSISEFSPLGAALSPATTGYSGGGLNLPYGIAIDSTGNVWTSNFGSVTSGSGPGKSISKFSPAGTALSPTGGYTGGGLAGPSLLAIDTSNNVWVGNNTGLDLSEFSSSGGAISGSNGYTGGGLNNPLGVAIDVAGNVWAANQNVFSLSKFSSSGSAISGSNGYTGGGLHNPDTVVIDASGNVWAGSASSNTISEFTSSGVPVNSTGYTAGGLSRPYAIAIDGSGNLWAANATGNTVTELNSSGTPLSGSAGFAGGGLNAPFGLAIDGSGNVWVSNNGSNSITEFVGAATPVVTPIVANLKTPYGTSAVNKP